MDAFFLYNFFIQSLMNVKALVLLVEQASCACWFCSAYFEQGWTQGPIIEAAQKFWEWSQSINEATRMSVALTTMTLVAKSFMLWTVDIEAPGSIPGQADVEN